MTRNPCRSRARAAGFTLIEVLVALAVLAGALYAGSGSLRSSARSATHLEESMLLEWTAENALTKMQLLRATDEVPLEPYQVTQYGLALTVTPTREIRREEHVAKLSVAVARTQFPARVLLRLETTSPL